MAVWRPMVRSALAVACLSCTDGAGPKQLGRVRVQPDWVVGDAATALDAVTGLFQLPPAAWRVHSEASAESLAVAWMKVLNSPPYDEAFLTQERGAPLDLGMLTRCAGAGLYEYVPYGTIVAGWPQGLEKSWGPWWSFAFCGPEGTAQVSIAVSDSHWVVHLSGDTIMADSGGGGAIPIMDAGVPTRYPTGMPLTPEEAVRAVYLAARVPIASVPIQYRVASEPPLCASWRLVLDSTVTVRVVSRNYVTNRRTPLTFRTRELYVHRAPFCYANDIVFEAALPDQPEMLTLPYLRSDSAGNRISDTLRLQLIGPSSFARVAVVR